MTFLYTLWVLETKMWGKVGWTKLEVLLYCETS